MWNLTNPLAENPAITGELFHLLNPIYAENGLAARLMGVTSFVVAAVITFFTLFYLFRDGRALWRRLAALIPLNPAQLETLTKGVSRTITASMYGGLAVAIAQGLLLGLAFWVLRLPSPVL